MLVLRSRRPARVIRGSFLILKIGPDFSLRCSISSIRASASARIVRNLIMRKRRLFRPKRSWTKKIGPGESSLIAMAAIANSGANKISRNVPTTTSNRRLASVRQLNGGTLCSEMIGSPSSSPVCERASLWGNRSESKCEVIPCSSRIATASSVWL